MEPEPKPRLASEDQTLLEPSAGSMPSGGPSAGGSIDALDLTGSLRDRYRLIRVLGKGGFGIVYLAHDRILDQDVAIKVLKFGLSSANDRQRFIFEARTGAKLRHPGIVNVFDIVQSDEGLQLVMEYYPGGTLAQLIRQEGALPPKQAVQFARQIAAALAYAHRMKIIHRDIKPANVFLAGDEIVKLGDFGIATHSETHEHTQTGEVMGTPLYMAPEQQRDSKDVDPRSDLYALGMTFYHMLVGKPPRVVDLDQIDGDLRDLIKKATAYERKDRPVSAEQFIAMLDRAASDLETRGTQATARLPAGARGPALEEISEDYPPLPTALSPTATAQPAQPMTLAAGAPAPGGSAGGALAETGSGDSTVTARPRAALAAPAEPKASHFGWPVVALVSVMMLGFIAVVYVMQNRPASSGAVALPAGTPTATATPAATPVSFAPPPATPIPATPTPAMIAAATPAPEAPVAPPPAADPAEELNNAAATRTGPMPPAGPGRRPPPGPRAGRSEMPADGGTLSPGDALGDIERRRRPGDRPEMRRGLEDLRALVRANATGRLLPALNAVKTLELAAEKNPNDPLPHYFLSLAYGVAAKLVLDPEKARDFTAKAERMRAQTRELDPDFEQKALNRFEQEGLPKLAADLRRVIADAEAPASPQQ